MLRRAPRCTRPHQLCPSTTFFRSKISIRLGVRPFLGENQAVVDELMDMMDAAARAMSGHASPDAVHQAGACAACSYEDYLRGTLSIKIEGMPPFEQIAPGAIRTDENDGLA